MGSIGRKKIWGSTYPAYSAYVIDASDYSNNEWGYLVDLGELEYFQGNYHSIHIGTVNLQSLSDMAYYVSLLFLNMKYLNRFCVFNLYFSDIHQWWIKEVCVSCWTRLSWKLSSCWSFEHVQSSFDHFW